MLAQPVNHSQILADGLPAGDGLHHNLLMLLGHELGSPLTFILAYLRLWQERGSPLNRDELDLVVEQALMLKSRLDDLLLLDQLETGLWRLTIEPVTVKEIVDAVVGRRAAQLQERNLSVVQDIECTEPILADKEMLVRAIDHLFTNACKFSSSGSSILVRAEQCDGVCRIRITDQGIGIPQEQYAQIFEPFFQADLTRARRYSGMGLGLRVVRAIVEKHGGRIQVQSRVGEGSTFTLVMPQLAGIPA
jgi:signal transduction histidine kinase